MSQSIRAEFLRDGRLRLLVSFGEVPCGFVTDGASVPCAVRCIFGHPYDRRHIRAGVRHDWRYAVGGDEKLRRAADRQYMNDLKQDGLGLVARLVEYCFVRLFGRSHFNYVEV